MSGHLADTQAYVPQRQKNLRERKEELGVSDSMQAFSANVARWDVRAVALNGFLTGSFLAQSMSWQDVVDAVLIEVVGGSEDDPLRALLRACIVTFLTVTSAWLVLRCCHCFNRPQTEPTPSITASSTSGTASSTSGTASSTSVSSTANPRTTPGTRNPRP